MYPIDSAGILPVRPTQESTRIVNPNGASKMQLLHEALSRTRMRSPQVGTTRTEAPRSARRVAMEGRRKAARELGVY